MSFRGESMKSTLLILLIVAETMASSVNQPTFCPLATWESNATTFANSSQIGSLPSSVFVDQNNRVYLTANQFDSIQEWAENSTSSLRNISCDACNQMRSLFVHSNGDVYIDNGMNGRVERWTPAATNYSLAFEMPLSLPCFGIFVNQYDHLYCAWALIHVVVMAMVPATPSVIHFMIGNTTDGSTPELLSYPAGLFVDDSLNLYVADSGNNRIQRFAYAQTNGTTVAGNGLMGALTLNVPTSVVLDADGYLFITDQQNHRIISSGPLGFRCIAGCSGTNGSAADQLSLPTSMYFDIDGNLYVADWYNSRIQIFYLSTNFCDSINETSTSLQSLVTSVTSDPTTVNLPASAIATAPIPATETATVPTNATVTATITKTATAPATATATGIFFVPTCSRGSKVGPYCNISQSACEALQPCQSNGTCQPTTAIRRGYNCSCPHGSTGDDCESNYRSCLLGTCWNGGRCQRFWNGSFNCICVQDWRGERCQYRVNYCDNVTCQNAGICRSLLRDYYCECLSGSYEGRHCEIVLRRFAIHRIISQSFAYIAIICICTVAGFIVVMDVLKYYFHIGPRNGKKVLRRCDRCRREKRLCCYCDQRRRRRPLTCACNGLSRIWPKKN